MPDHQTVSFIIPTIGRESLQRTLASIDKWPGDEVLAIQLDPPGGDWGGKERNIGITRAICDWLAFIDDDDYYVPGAREIMHRAILENPQQRPILFRMQYPSGRVVWDEPKLRCGNVGSPMIFIPNIKAMLPNPWGSERVSDFQFVNCFGWQARKIIWRPEIIAQVGHEDERWWSYQPVLACPGVVGQGVPGK